MFEVVLTVAIVVAKVMDVAIVDTMVVASELVLIALEEMLSFLLVDVIAEEMIP